MVGNVSAQHAGLVASRMIVVYRAMGEDHQYSSHTQINKRVEKKNETNTRNKKKGNAVFLTGFRTGTISAWGIDADKGENQTKSGLRETLLNWIHVQSSSKCASLSK